MEKLIKEVLEANLLLPKYGLVMFTWGNVSAIDRDRGLVVIKPSGVSFKMMDKDYMVVVDLDGKVIKGDYKPSSDTITHLELYKSFDDIGAIAHAHSQMATSWAQACKSIPVYGTTHADYFYGEIPCTRKLTREEIENDYELNAGKAIVEIFKEKRLKAREMPGVLVAGHAPFVWGVNAAHAVHKAVVLEECAKMAINTLLINPAAQPIEKPLLDKHYLPNRGKSSSYGL